MSYVRELCREIAQEREFWSGTLAAVLGGSGDTWLERLGRTAVPWIAA